MNKMCVKNALAKAALAFVFAVQAASAHSEEDHASSDSEHGQVWLASGFFSHHFKRSPNYNESNTGLSLQYSLDKHRAIAIGHYENSVREPSTYLHFVYTPLALGFFKLGGAVGLLNGYPTLREGRFTPVVLPVSSWTFKALDRDVGINIMYIPTISRHVDGAVAVQFKFRIS